MSFTFQCVQVNVMDALDKAGTDEPAAPSSAMPSPGPQVVRYDGDHPLYRGTDPCSAAPPRAASGSDLASAVDRTTGPAGDLGPGTALLACPRTRSAGEPSSLDQHPLHSTAPGLAGPQGPRLSSPLAPAPRRPTKPAPPPTLDPPGPHASAPSSNSGLPPQPPTVPVVHPALVGLSTGKQPSAPTPG
eukprot:gene1144-2664_t